MLRPREWSGTGSSMQKGTPGLFGRLNQRQGTPEAEGKEPWGTKLLGDLPPEGRELRHEAAFFSFNPGMNAVIPRAINIFKYLELNPFTFLRRANTN